MSAILLVLTACRPTDERPSIAAIAARVTTPEAESFTASDNASGDYFGYAVADAGDVNGDGYGDVIIGAYLDDDGGSSSGGAYLYYGAASGLVLSTEEKIIASDDASFDFFGYAVAGAGDVNGDGYDDVIIGAYGEDDNGSYSGAAYVYHGSSGGIVSSSEEKISTSDGTTNDFFGWSVAGAGDVDGDGYDDVIVGAYGDDDSGSTSGSAYVYHGSSGGIDTASEVKLTASDGDSYAYFGATVSGAGDVDGDGYDDVIVGAYGDDAGGYNAGAAYVYEGSSAGIRSASEVKLTSSSGSSSDRFGVSVSQAGDVNGDGYDDVIVGASVASSQGAAYVYEGSSTGIRSASEDELTASDAANNDYFGISVSGAGDIDGDGYDDVVVGAYLEDSGGISDLGAAYVYYGSSASGMGDEQKVYASDGDTSDQFGFSVSTAGDIDGDGFDDLIIGAYGDEPSGSSSGSVYTFSGSNTEDDADGDGYTVDDGDCDDEDASTYPGADEVCDDVDNDCDGSTDESAIDASTWYDDGDGDGFGDAADTTTDCDAPAGHVADSTDCDDTDSSINPDAAEVCDGVDNDCDGSIDEGVTDTFYADDDGDGYGDASSTTTDCEAPSGYVEDATDCDDSNASTHPGAAEVCDGEDNDCDGSTDEGATDLVTWYADADGDGYGDTSSTAESCSEPSGYVSDSTDCDDTDSSINPGAAEECDGDDNDCDGDTDEDDATDASTWYEDSDADGYGDAASTTTACDQPSGHVADGTDCDDDEPAANPGEVEVCDEIDNDCDGSVDEWVTSTFYADDDGDGYGDAADSTEGCSAPSGYIADSTDCDDADADAHPGATETAYDGIDQDCDGSDLTDVDGDGYDSDVVSGGTDCDDSDSSTHPGAAESADGVDEDCDGTVDEGTVWYDDDGDGYTEDGGDCDDTDSSLHPGAPETEDGVDEDCDGVVDEGTDAYDDDGDGLSENDGDCNDDDAAVSPDANEVDGNGVDDDCDGVVDTGRFDPDGDGYLEEAGDCDDTDPTIHPGAEESPDGVDEDCDGVVDEGTTAYDDDGDGLSEEQGDCNDDDPDISTDAPEIPDNGIDDDCDGTVDEHSDRSDDDGDGWTEWAGDCDDADATVYPGAEELSDGADNDCDDDVDEGTDAFDNDGDGYSVDEGDCDDADLWSYPGGYEFCDEADNNCNGAIDETCDEELEVEVVSSDKGGCATTQGPSGLWLLAGFLVLLRRRRLLPLLALGTIGCSTDSTIQSQSRSLLIDEALIDLGIVAVGSVQTVEIELVSVGSGSVNISGVDIGADPASSFTVDSWPDTLTSGEQGTLSFTFAPTEPGAHQAELVISSDATEPEQAVVFRAFAAEGRVQVFPERIDFGAVSAGASVTELVTVRNLGELELTVEASLSEDPAFSITGSIDSIRPDEERQLSVTFAPDDTVAAAADLALTFTSGVDSTAVSLVGNDCSDGTPALYDLDGDGVTSCSGDCDDEDADIHPGASEVWDGVDNDCDGTTDEGTEAYDDDGDGASENDGDCNDSDVSIGPDAAEVDGNGIDDDCDGVVDLGSEDPDGDGYTADGGDCDEGDGSVHPGAPETEDGVDEDCDGVVDEGTNAYDDDGDGTSENDGDCNDSDASIYPGAAELEDWQDNDCDGTVDEGTDHADDDGDGFTEDGGDCDDADSDISPAEQEEEGDGIDNDCDGTAE